MGTLEGTVDNSGVCLPGTLEEQDVGAAASLRTEEQMFELFPRRCGFTPDTRSLPGINIFFSE